MKIYRKVSRHDLEPGMLRGLAKHMKHLADEGVRDPTRLTVHGLSYLREFDGKRKPSGRKSW